MSKSIRFLFLGIIITIIVCVGLLFIISIYIGLPFNSLYAYSKEDKIADDKIVSNKDISFEKIFEYGKYVDIIEPKTEKITICAVGDILLDRGVEKKIKKYGFKFLFNDVREELLSADITFANLENPASFLGKAYYGKPKNITFRADPSSLFCLEYADFDIVSLANNHAYDYRAEALTETMDLLDLLGIKYTGAGRNIKEARTPVIFKIKGYTIAFLGYTESIWSTIEADNENSGIVHLKEDTVIDDINKTYRDYNPDYIILSIHWGIEHKNVPRKSDIELAYNFIDAGADIILGHHPHVIQSIEIYKGGVIVYSLGNFAFDMSSKETYRSMIFNVTLSEGKIIDTHITPVKIIEKKYNPTIAKGKDAQRIFNEISEYSMELGTAVEIVDDKYARLILGTIE